MRTLLIFPFLLIASCTAESQDAMSRTESTIENKKSLTSFSTGVRKPIKEGYLIEVKIQDPSLYSSLVTISARGKTEYGENDSLSLINTSDQFYTIHAETPLKVSLKGKDKVSPLSTSLVIPYNMIKYGNIELELELILQSEENTTLTTLSEKVWITRLPPVYDPKNPRKKLYEKKY